VNMNTHRPHSCVYSGLQVDMHANAAQREGQRLHRKLAVSIKTSRSEGDAEETTPAVIGEFWGSGLLESVTGAMAAVTSVPLALVSPTKPISESMDEDRTFYCSQKKIWIKK
jgi:hypothetical protein